jgi:Tc toxin complex TcA C-terminal TcB-binding domain
MTATGTQALIVLKLLPDKAVPPRDSATGKDDGFQSYIRKLSITAWDIGIDDSQNGTRVGEAARGVVLPEPTPLILDEATKATATVASDNEAIGQLTSTLANAIFQDQVVEGEVLQKSYLLSTATALIIATIPSPGSSVNLRFTLERNGLSVPAPATEYNIPFVPVPDASALVPRPHSTSLFQTVAAYIQLPPPAVGVSKTTPYLQPSTKGQIPTLGQVVEAADLVLANNPAQDPPYTSIKEPQQTAMTEQQATFVATKIAWNRSLSPMPNAGSLPLGDLYTVFSGKTPSGYDATTAAQNLQTFESNLTSYQANFNGDALSFTPLVFAASAAAWCESQTYSAGQVGVSVPVNGSDPGTVNRTTVILTGASGEAGVSFGVPAAYFYVLSQGVSTMSSASQRYSAALATPQDQLLQVFQAAVSSGALSKTSSPLTNNGAAMTPADAAAHLAALAAGTSSNAPTVQISAVSKLVVPNPNESGSSWTNKLVTNPKTHVQLLLHAVTNGHSDLVDAASSHFQVESQADLAKITDKQWHTFFDADPSLLPAFTLPGGVQQRTNSFIQRLGRFSTVPVEHVTSSVQIQPSVVPSFGIPARDALSQFIVKYNALANSPFDFSQTFDKAAFEQAISEVFPSNEYSRNSLKQLVHVIQTLYQLTAKCPSNIQFSVMEALYARGITSIESVNSLTLAEFETATAGTVAYQFASSILPSSTTASASQSPFAPINFEDSLCDCVPPEHLSPFSRVQYLHELFELPFGTSTLGQLASTRRGAVGNLLATPANLEVAVPLIDIVNESLEYLASNLDSGCGAIYNTTRDPDTLAAIPEYSSPASPVQQPPIYATLQTCFTARELPYSQGLDVCRTYLDSVRTDRFAVMRHFRKDITEFCIDATLEPKGFHRELWRLPVRLEIALEYLQISGEEYSILFSGNASDADTLDFLGLKDFDQALVLSTFLKFTGLSYEEFLELWKSKYVAFRQDGPNPSFPPNEPCSLKNIRIDFGMTGSDLSFALRKLFTFIRLHWHLLGISFNNLAAISEALQLFANGKINGNFIRQLVAFMILRDKFGWLKETDETGLLSLFGGADPPIYPLKPIVVYSKTHYHCATRSSSVETDLQTHLSELSILAGFTERDSWHANPTSTLRFSEILAKIYASEFTVGQILSVFSGSHPAGEDPFPLSDATDSEFDPLKIPDASGEFGLWCLRRKLLGVEIDGSEQREWAWERIEAALLGMGTDQTALNALKTHFFLEISERFSVPLQYPPGEARCIWRDGPIYYDSVASELRIQLPVADRRVLHQLRNMRQLSDTEAAAVQNLYFAPRTALAPFAFIFTNFEHAIQELTHEVSGLKRFEFFQRQFALCHRRCEIIAQHLAEHVATVTKREFPTGQAVAWKILLCLFADGNRPRDGSWEMDNGEAPKSYLWHSPSGTALGALLGLTGTGLVGHFNTGSGAVWRQVTGDLTFFGKEQNHINCPVPTLIPNLTLAIPLTARQSVSASNGFAIKDDGEFLGGAEPFSVCWKGVLLIDQPGQYILHVDGHHSEPGGLDSDSAKRDRWFIRLQRGQRTWNVIDSDNDVSSSSSEPQSLLRGAYDIEIFYDQPHPIFGGDLVPEHCRSGFKVEYRGPDTGEQLIPIPIRQLFRATNENTLAKGIEGPGETAHQFLEEHYTSSLRDVRRTYQRAFKAILFAHGFSLSAKRSQDPSELDYMLHRPRNFAGESYYRSGTGFLTHQAFFDFNFLPVTDPYEPPKDDSRQDPSLQRRAALFEWWERMFDYSKLRREVRPRHLNQLFYDAAVQDPEKVDQLLPYLTLDISLASQVLDYFASDGELMKFMVSSPDFTDERWPIRVKHAANWIRNVQRYFRSTGWEHASPYLWASDDPNSMIGNESGNYNLTHFLQNNPQNHDRILRINDGLRERARKALLSYLCGMDRVSLPAVNDVGASSPKSYAKSPTDLTGLLLQDVEVGICQKETRVENAVSALQAFINRSRLGLEVIRPNWEFLNEWDRRFATFEFWTADKRRDVYKEDSLQWEEYGKALKIESFRNLETQLRRGTFTIPKPGGLVSWPQPPIPTGNDLQSGEQTVFEIPSTPASEGLGLIAHPDSAGRPSWVGPETLADVSLWIRAGANLGTRFVRVAAATKPPSTTADFHRPEDAACVDEFYFWIEDSEYYDPKDAPQDAELGHNPSDPDPRGDWDNRQDLPKLLQWKPRKKALLRWCRIHFGKFDPPSCSTEGVPVEANGKPLLKFERREADSLFFGITEAVAPGGGFRYDLATDAATVLPQAELEALPNTEFPPPLKSYPFFAYFSPGAPLLPLSDFSTVLLIANTLRSEGQFREALVWYERIVKPLDNDNDWMQLEPKKRAILLEYLDTLLQLGDSRQSTSENTAVVFNLIQKIMGVSPAWKLSPEEPDPTNIKDFKAAAPPLNPRLLSLYNRVQDRLSLVHHCTSHQYCYGCTPHHLESSRHGRSSLVSHRRQFSHRRHPYRFSAVLSNAMQLAQTVSAFGAGLLSALDSGDSSYLEALQTTYDTQILDLALQSKKNEYRNADWQVQALVQSRLNALARYNYYNGLYGNGFPSNLNDFEQGYLTNMGNASSAQTAATVSNGLAEAASYIPDSFFGDVGIAGPTDLEWAPIGTKLSGAFKIIGHISEIAANIQQISANENQANGEWDRRSIDWAEQMTEILIELQEIERQKLAADRQKAIALRDLNSHRQQMENARHIRRFMRDKFTKQDLYLFLQQEMSVLYRRAYDLAIEAARDAESLLYYELRTECVRKDYLPPMWDNLRDGLTAGERLQLALNLMESSYLTCNCREYELSKAISLAVNFPAAFLRLKATGECQIDVPEWLFDLDFPGQYMRRIKTVSLTIPCVTGPYINVNCKLQLLAGRIRVSPDLDEGYDEIPDDPRFALEYGVTEAIATSTAQSDSGLFTLNFEDERYLPFEFTGAISQWRIQLPPENNQFDLKTLTDIVIQLHYTSRDGGAVLRRAANDVAQRKLPGNGQRLFDLRQDFGDAWELFKQQPLGEARSFPLSLARDMFPFLTGNRNPFISRIEIFIEVAGTEVGEHLTLKYYRNTKEEKSKYGEEIACIVEEQCSGLYHGHLDIKLGPIIGQGLYDFGKLFFPKDAGDMAEIYFLCQFGTEEGSKVRGR